MKQSALLLLVGRTNDAPTANRIWRHREISFIHNKFVLINHNNKINYNLK